MFFNEILKKSYKNKNFKCNDKNMAHRVIKQCSDLFLGYREIAGSNPAPGILNPRNFPS